MIVNLNEYVWGFINYLSMEDKSKLLRCLCLQENPEEPAIKIIYYMLTAKKSKKATNDKVKEKITYNWETGMLEGITPELIDYWSNRYPKVNVELELNKISAWQKANPDKRKEKYERFINGWLSRTQDKGGKSI